MYFVLVCCDELSFDQDIVVICYYGVCSFQVVMFFENKGFGGVQNLIGGVEVWVMEVDLIMCCY